MATISEFFESPKEFICPNCNKKLSVMDIDSHMTHEISGTFEVCVEYRYSFIDDLKVKCNVCGFESKVVGCVWTYPGEGETIDNLRLLPLQAQFLANKHDNDGAIVL